ncbi:MAG: putative lipid II flippase FtsW [Desulfobacteraceae bacterium]|jgi:cell division protein FtsW
MAKTEKATGGYDFFILIPAVMLLGIGLVAIYSSSSILADYKLHDSYFYLKRQTLFALVGVFFLIIAKNIPVELYRKLAYPALVISFILLALLFIPGIGKEVNGATRWIDIGTFGLQPSELVKLSLAVYMAYSMSKKGTNMSSFSKGLLPHLLVVGAFMYMILIQPDLGTTVIIGSWLMILLFVAGLNLLHLLGMAIIACPMILWLITHAEYRWNRLLAFMRPWDYAHDLGFQIIHSFYAFGSGGVLGVGLGNSKQKLGYLPEPHTDFILSIMAEELGLIGVIVILILFSILIIRGIKISLDASDLYSSYLALGITILLGLQIVINMGVVMGLLPTKGLTLPFLSYGGSSLMVNLAAIGILMSISARSR